MSHPYTYPESRHPWYVRYTYAFLKFVLRPFFLLFIKEVSGIENIPKTGPAIIAFNHQSYLDFFCFIAVCPRSIHYLSAEKFFSHFIWKHIMRFTGQIKVHRREHDKHILHTTIRDHLKNEKVIGIFPEGTRAPDPVEMLHAFTGVAKYAVGGEVPVIPVGIRGTHEILSRHDKFPRFKRIVSIHIGKPIHFTEHHGKNLTEREYRDLTDRVMLEIAHLSMKRYSHVGKNMMSQHLMQPTTNKKELAIFDVDGTLVEGQSQKFFLRYLLSVRRIGLFFYLTMFPWFVFYKIGFVKDPRKPMEYAFSFMKGKSIQDIGNLAHDFFETVLKKHLYPGALDIIREHQRAGREVILVSNIAEPIVRELAFYLRVSRYVCTALETAGGYYTGKVKDIVYGEHKTEIMKKFMDTNNFDMGNAWAYGDHASDKFLLSLVKHPTAVNPSPVLLMIARQKHWPVLTFKGTLG